MWRFSKSTGGTTLEPSSRFGGRGKSCLWHGGDSILCHGGAVGAFGGALLRAVSPAARWSAVDRWDGSPQPWEDAMGMKTCPKCSRPTKVGVNAKGEKVRYCVGCNLNVEYCGCEPVVGKLGGYFASAGRYFYNILRLDKAVAQVSAAAALRANS